MKGWEVHGAVELPEIRDIVREELVTDEYIANKLCPEVLVDAPMAKIRVIGAGQDKRVVNTERAFNGSYSRVKWAMGSDYYETDVFGIEVSWDNMEAKANEAVMVDEQSEASLIATGILKTGREARVSESLFDTNVFTGADYTSTEAAFWGTLTPSEVEVRLKVGEAKLFKRYGLRRKHLSFVAHPNLINAMVGMIAKEDGIAQTTAVMLMSEDEQAEVVRKRYHFKEVVSTTAPYNDLPANYGEYTEANFDDIYPENMALLCVLANGKTGFKGAGVGFQPVYRKFTTDFEIEQYAENGVDGQVIRAKEWRGIKIRPGYGFLYTAVAAV